MKRNGAILALLGAAILSVPGAALASHSSVDMYGDDIPHMLVTVTCAIYSEHLDGAITSLSDALELSLGDGMTDCTIDTDYFEVVQTPTVDESIVIVMPEGAGYPECAAENGCFVPDMATIQTGGSVTWENNDRVQHTVTHASDNPLFNVWVTPGNSYTHVFDTAGTYDYKCNVHPWATGTITVTDTGSVSVEELARQYVDEQIELYKEMGVDAFEYITENGDDYEDVDGFIIDLNGTVIVSHSSNPAFIGFPVEPLLAKAFIPIDGMIQLLIEEGTIIPLSYPLPDPQGNIIGYDSGQFKHYDGYIFSARHSLSEPERVQSIVQEMVFQFNRDGTAIFDTIDAFMSNDDSYPFVLDPQTQTVVAHGNNPDRVGATSIVITNSSIPAEAFLTWEDGDADWAEYTFFQPSTGQQVTKISWVQMQGGYLFGSGYYP